MDGQKLLQGLKDLKVFKCSKHGNKLSIICMDPKAEYKTFLQVFCSACLKQHKELLQLQCNDYPDSLQQLVLQLQQQYKGTETKFDFSPFGNLKQQIGSLINQITLSVEYLNDIIENLKKIEQDLSKQSEIKNSFQFSKSALRGIIESQNGDDLKEQIFEFSKLLEQKGTSIELKPIYELSEMQIKKGFKFVNNFNQILNEFSKKLLQIDTQFKILSRAQIGKLNQGLDNYRYSYLGADLQNSDLIQKSDIPMMIGWINTFRPDSIQLKLIFKATRDGFQNFKQFCEGAGPTLVLVQSGNGNTFGGFTPCKWAIRDVQDLKDSKHFYIKDSGFKSFLFSVNNKSIMPIIKQHYDEAAFYDQQHGPVFGLGPDLMIQLNQTGTSCLGKTYPSPKGAIYKTKEASNYLAGSENFDVLDYQVYQLNTPASTLNTPAASQKKTTEFKK